MLQQQIHQLAIEYFASLVIEGNIQNFAEGVLSGDYTATPEEFKEFGTTRETVESTMHYYIEQIAEAVKSYQSSQQGYARLQRTIQLACEE